MLGAKVDRMVLSHSPVSISAPSGALPASVPWRQHQPQIVSPGCSAGRGFLFVARETSELIDS
jgi:hypothetical protein